MSRQDLNRIIREEKVESSNKPFSLSGMLGQADVLSAGLRVLNVSGQVREEKSGLIPQS